MSNFEKSGKTKIVVICGPTASGKSRLAVDIARRFIDNDTGAEIINADSMQVYQEMNIATAMPSESEKKGVPHHLFGILEPQESFSVAQWLTLAREKIAEIKSRSAMPIVVGGTGLYISSLVDNIIFDKVAGNPDFRTRMYALAAQYGNSFLLEKLREVDPEAASRLHENNVKRVIRALETFEMSGIQLEKRVEQSRKTCSPYEAFVFGIDFSDRKILYERINNRVDVMLANGLLEEAKSSIVHNVPPTSKFTSTQAIGHKELLPYIIGEEKLETCIENLKAKTRNYAKRQLTWFRKNEHIEWVEVNETSRYALILKKTVEKLEKMKK